MERYGLLSIVNSGDRCGCLRSRRVKQVIRHLASALSSLLVICLVFHSWAGIRAAGFSSALVNALLERS